MAYNKGDILIIEPYAIDGLTHEEVKKRRRIAIYQSERYGDEDLSYHGSPRYEEIITAQDVLTGKTREYGNQTYHWQRVLGYIDDLEDKLRKVYNLVSMYGGHI